MVSYFNTKFVIAKLKKQSASMSWTSEFQYKICYSKIKQIDTQKQVCKNFNTKFVIAKLNQS